MPFLQWSCWCVDCVCNSHQAAVVAHEPTTRRLCAECISIMEPFHSLLRACILFTQSN